jgi:hypothetical protein
MATCDVFASSCIDLASKSTLSSAFAVCSAAARSACQTHKQTASRCAGLAETGARTLKRMILLRAALAWLEQKIKKQN